METEQHLQIQWGQDVGRLSEYLKRPISDAWIDEQFQFLSEAYGNPRRCYHNLDHIASCIEVLDSYRDEVGDYLVLLFAFWYHDCVYERGASDNEQASAAVAGDALAVVDQGFAGRVSHYIRLSAYATVSGAMITDQDYKWFHDIDHYSFSLPFEKFMEDGEKLRCEEGALDDAGYRNRRKCYLTRLEERRSGLYLTECFRNRFEGRARQNIHKALARLEDSGDLRTFSECRISGANEN